MNTDTGPFPGATAAFCCQLPLEKQRKGCKKKPLAGP